MTDREVPVDEGVEGQTRSAACRIGVCLRPFYTVLLASAFVPDLLYATLYFVLV